MVNVTPVSYLLKNSYHPVQSICPQGWGRCIAHGGHLEHLPAQTWTLARRRRSLANPPAQIAPAGGEHPRQPQSHLNTTKNSFYISIVMGKQGFMSVHKQKYKFQSSRKPCIQNFK